MQMNSTLSTSIGNGLNKFISGAAFTVSEAHHCKRGDVCTDQGILCNFMISVQWLDGLQCEEHC